MLQKASRRTIFGEYIFIVEEDISSRKSIDRESIGIEILLG